ncbi:hypothetical protein [Streptococcus cristatus]|uniref:Uncharacterized protein n=1 Tax=Streptococcus cristatus TaxID=45634 RepID=A0A139N5D9_STRCR|nr:hypothetical protein [Streptococcus cristatus]KXT70961.1 hypothetical protein SCRDD08_00279 [Streptococcus cristatus]
MNSNTALKSGIPKCGQPLSAIEKLLIEVDYHIMKTLRDADMTSFLRVFLLYPAKEKD